MQTAQNKQHKKHKKENLSEDQKQLVKDYFNTIDKLHSLEVSFQHITDSELISACVYEMNAAQQRYAYLLGRLKAEDISYLRILR